MAAAEAEEAFVGRFGQMEDKSLLYRVDRMVLISGLKKLLPWMNGERLVFLFVALAVAGLLEGVAILGNTFAGIFLLVAQPVFLYVALLGLTNRTYNQIEDGTSLFVSILTNHARSSSDILTIMQRSLPSLDGPLAQLAEGFVADAERTGNVDAAFDFMKDSMENRQLRTIIMNLKCCNHYQANFEEVLTQMLGQVTAELSAREDRKNALFSMKLTLAIILPMALVIVWIIGAGLGIDVWDILLGNTLGQFLLLMTGLLLLLVLVKMFATDK